MSGRGTHARRGVTAVWVLGVIVGLSGCFESGGGGQSGVRETGFLDCTLGDPRCGEKLSCTRATHGQVCVAPPDTCVEDQTCDCLGPWLCGADRCVEDGATLRCVPAAAVDGGAPGADGARAPHGGDGDAAGPGPVGDRDDDGVPDARDNCPGKANNGQADVDEDGVGDVCDHCPEVFDPDQRDTDGDGVGDACEDLPDGGPPPADARPDAASPSDAGPRDDAAAPTPDAAPPCPTPLELYLDRDGDGFGDDATLRVECAAIPGYVARGGDCDDDDRGRSPGTDEVCGDGVDQDCDGADAVPVPAVVRPRRDLGVVRPDDRRFRTVDVAAFPDGRLGVAYDLHPAEGVRDGNVTYYTGQRVHYLPIAADGTAGEGIDVGACARPRLAVGPMGRVGLACGQGDVRGVIGGVRYAEFPWLYSFDADGADLEGVMAHDRAYARSLGLTVGIAPRGAGWVLAVPRSTNGLDLLGFHDDLEADGERRHDPPQTREAALASDGARVGLVTIGGENPDNQDTLDFAFVDVLLSRDVPDEGGDLLADAIGSDTVEAAAIASGHGGFLAAGVARRHGLGVQLFDAITGERRVAHRFDDIDPPARVRAASTDGGFAVVVTHTSDDFLFTWVDVLLFGRDGAAHGRTRVLELPQEVHVQFQLEDVGAAAVGDRLHLVLVPGLQTGLEHLEVEVGRCPPP